MTAVENKIPDVSGLVTNTDYNTKISDIEKKITDHDHDKYTATSGFNKLATEDFKARLAQANLVTKTDFNADLQDISKRITSNKSKHLLVENELKKLKTFDSSYFKGKDNIAEWKSKGLFDQVIKSYNNSISPTIKFTGERMYVKFNGSCLKQDKITFNHGKIVSIYNVYDLKSNVNSFDPTLQNRLFGAVKLTKNIDIDKYEYAGYGMGFDSKGTFSHPRAGTGVNVVVFGADMSSSVHANNRAKSILVLGEGFTLEVEDTTFYAEKIYSTNFTTTRKKFYLSLHYNGDNSYLFVNGTEIIRFQAKDSEIVANPLSL